jgi:hypothetical protein
MRRKSDIVAGLDDLALCQAQAVSLYNLLGESLGDCWCGIGTVQQLRRRILEL